MMKQKQLIEFIVQDLVAFQVEDENIAILDAANRFYNSTVFEKLQDSETGLYLESSAYVYDLFQTEMKSGRLLQQEV